jgi:Glycosyl hydrolases family 6
MRRRRRSSSLAGTTLLILIVAVAGAVAGRRAAVRPAYSTGCGDPYPAQHDPGNPLMLRNDPGADPLTGANFFVDGPTHGAAAGEVARLLGIDSLIPIGQFLPAFDDSKSWTSFKRFVTRVVPLHPDVAGNVQLLGKIADQPEAQRVSSVAEGGTPSGLADFMRKLFCHNFTADRRTVPIISTDFLHQTLGGCPTAGTIDAYMPLFKQRVDEVVAGTGNRPVVYLLELDAIGSSSCIAAHRAMPAWEAALRYEVDRFATLPHAVVYVEAGYSDANSPRYTAHALNRIDIGRIRGFYTNDTHQAWTIKEIRWGDKVSKLTDGAHFIVNTSSNGTGPLRNPHPRTQGVDNLCNPPRRGLGPRPTTSTGFPNVDAFLWTHVPGNSSGSCNGGPPAGTFWPALALGLAARANGKLGPGYPSMPY